MQRTWIAWGSSRGWRQMLGTEGIEATPLDLESTGLALGTSSTGVLCQPPAPPVSHSQARGCEGA